MSEYVKPNTQALSWFFGENQKETLRLSPKYQRNPIWSLGQKCFLIDSIISGVPIPQIYINIVTEGKGTSKKTIYEIVDGQQRIRTILEFMSDKWKLVATTAKSYPVSNSYKPHIGKRYSELPEKIQESIWNYQLAVQELRSWSEKEINHLFRRLNYVVEKLNSQELRHSQYFGEFVNSVEVLARQSFWDETNFFSRRESQRMKDVEYISELFLIVVDGVQDQQKTIDKFYAEYDVVFPNKSKFIFQFAQVIESLRSIKVLISNTRFSKKADFYGLFAAVSDLVKSKNKIFDLAPSSETLENFAKSIDSKNLTTEDLKNYHSTVIEGPNKLPKRQMRKDILKRLLLVK